MRTSALVLLVLGLLATGCARTHLFYDTRELHHLPLHSNQRRALEDDVASRLKGRSVVWVDPDGKERAITPDAAGLAKLGLPELGALWLATSTGEVGGENDVRVRTSLRSSVPVSVLTGLDGSVRLISPPRHPAQSDEVAPSEEEIKDRFGLTSKLPGKWRDVERLALADALSTLLPEERAVVRTIPFDRQAQPRDHDMHKAALYEMHGCGAVIFLYSSGVRGDAFRFLGEPAAPKSAVLHSLVHEIGHAFEQSSARAKYCEANRARGAEKARLIDEGNHLADRSPVLDAYLQALGNDPAPTDYGNTSPHESFAESFALFHLDPAALKRTNPGVYAWFAAGGHLKARSSS